MPPFYNDTPEMRKQLEIEIFESRDILFLPEYEIGRISESTTPYEFRLNEKDYPIELIYTAASISGFRGKEIAERQIELLGDSNKIVRYWAVSGLRSQSTDDILPFSDAIIKAVNDEYPPEGLSPPGCQNMMPARPFSRAYLVLSATERGSS